MKLDQAVYNREVFCLTAVMSGVFALGYGYYPFVAHLLCKI